MPDIDKVINGLEICRTTNPSCTKCPYKRIHNTCIDILHDDAIELLKEQQKRIEELESEKSWIECPDMMGKW